MKVTLKDVERRETGIIISFDRVETDIWNWTQDQYFESERALIDYEGKLWGDPRLDSLKPGIKINFTYFDQFYKCNTDLNLARIEIRDFNFI